MCSSVGILFLPVSFLHVVALLRAICVHFARSHASVHFFPVFLFSLGVHYSSSLPYFSLCLLRGQCPSSLPYSLRLCGVVFWLRKLPVGFASACPAGSCFACVYAHLCFFFVRSFIAVAALEDRFCHARSILASCGIYPCFFFKLTAGSAIALRIHLSLWDICFLMA